MPCLSASQLADHTHLSPEAISFNMAAAAGADAAAARCSSAVNGFM